METSTDQAAPPKRRSSSRKRATVPLDTKSKIKIKTDRSGNPTLGVSEPVEDSPLTLIATSPSQDTFSAAETITSNATETTGSVPSLQYTHTLQNCANSSANLLNSTPYFNPTFLNHPISLEQYSLPPIYEFPYLQPLTDESRNLCGLPLIQRYQYPIYNRSNNTPFPTHERDYPNLLELGQPTALQGPDQCNGIPPQQPLDLRVSRPRDTSNNIASDTERTRISEPISYNLLGTRPTPTEQELELLFLDESIDGLINSLVELNERHNFPLSSLDEYLHDIEIPTVPREE